LFPPDKVQKDLPAEPAGPRVAVNIEQELVFIELFCWLEIRKIYLVAV
jgi:hypothetical protein